MKVNTIFVHFFQSYQWKVLFFGLPALLPKFLRYGLKSLVSAVRFCPSAPIPAPIRKNPRNRKQSNVSLSCHPRLNFQKQKWAKSERSRNSVIFDPAGFDYAQRFEQTLKEFQNFLMERHDRCQQEKAHRPIIMVLLHHIIGESSQVFEQSSEDTAEETMSSHSFSSPSRSSSANILKAAAASVSLR